MRSWHALLAATLTGCANIETTKPPAIELPQTTAQAPANLDRFWTLFDDAQLSALVDEAQRANLDLRLAMARIDEARAAAQLARSGYFPSVDAYFGASRNRTSNDTARQFPGPLITTTYTGGLSAAYEVDLWGKVRNGSRAAAANLLAARYSTETVRVALAAQVASTYFSLRALDAELDVTRATLTGREENVALQRQRFDAGLANDLDLKLAEAERAAVAAVAPAIERARAQTEAALAQLLGRSAKHVFTPAVARGATIDAALAAPEVPAGLPSDMLARRPDVRQAEAQLVAADARIAEARTAYFPSLTLTARYGGESSDLADLFSSPARVWSIAGNLLQPLVALNRIGAQVDAAQARREQAAVLYQQTVQSAFRDAHDALVAHRAAREIYTAQDERRAKLGDALKLADLRYKNGYSSFLEVLDAQRNLLDAERARVNALRDRQTALVDLYKALGGGWEVGSALSVQR